MAKIKTTSDNQTNAYASIANAASQWMQPFEFRNATDASFMDPLRIYQAYADLAGRQLEECAKPMAAAWQQLIDMQMLWFGQLLETTSAAVAQCPTKTSADAQAEWCALLQRYVENLESKPKP